MRFPQSTHSRKSVLGLSAVQKTSNRAMIAALFLQRKTLRGRVASEALSFFTIFLKKEVLVTTCVVHAVLISRTLR